MIKYKKLIKNIISLLCVLVLCLGFLLPVTQLGKSFAAEEKEFILTATKDKITADFPSGTEGKLVRFHPNDYHSSAEFIYKYDGLGDDNQEDGYDTDRNYYSADSYGYIEGNADGGQLVFDRISDIPEETGHDKILDKYYVIKGGREEGGKLYGGEVVLSYKSVTEFTSERNYIREETPSIKGLEVVNYDDAEVLGIRHGVVGLDINRIVTGRTASDAIEYDYNGRKYYYSQGRLQSNDNQIKRMTEAGVQVTQTLLIYVSNLSAESLLGHPDVQPIKNFEYCLSGVNVTSYESAEAFAAVCSFLADRYTREDKLYGRVYNFIVGNETESACQWNNMGYLPLDEYIRQYERAVRIAYTAMKSIWSGLNVMLCCSHFWNVDVATQYLNYDPENYRPFIGKGSYTTRTVLTEFAKVAKEGGDYGWQLAYHPYRANAIGEAVFWNDVNIVASAHDEEKAAKVTPLNIEVLAKFLKKDNIAFNGVGRDFYVTEYGAGTPHGTLNASDYDPEKITDKSLNEQVASYIYSYYQLKFNGAKAYVLHRHLDVSYESGENMGIWLRKKNSNELYAKKPIWTVMKYIDTERSLEFTNPYLKYIRDENGNVPTSWSDLIEGFDITKLEKSPTEYTGQLSQVNEFANTENCGFEDGGNGGWNITDSATSEVILQDGEIANTGEYGMAVTYQSVGSQGRGLAKKGLRKDFENGIDLTKYGALNFSVYIAPDGIEKKNYLTVRFYSGYEVAEFTAEVKEDEYVNLSAEIDPAKWQYFDNVDHIKIWYSSDSTEAPGGMMYFDDIGFSKTTKSKGKGCSAITFGCVSSLLAITSLTFIILKRKGSRN